MDHLERDIRQTLQDLVREEGLGPDEDAAILSRIRTHVAEKQWGGGRRMELRWVGVACLCMLMLFAMTKPALQGNGLHVPASQVSPWVSARMTPAVTRANVSAPTALHPWAEATPASPGVQAAPNPETSPQDTRVPGQASRSI